MKRSIGQKLLSEMARMGWDQKELAEHSGVSESAISRHKNNERAPTLEIVHKYAAAFGVPVAYLLDAENEAEREQLRVPRQIQAERAARRLSPNARRAIDDFDWSAVTVDEEQSVIGLLEVTRYDPDDDPSVEYWTTKIRQLLRFIESS